MKRMALPIVLLITVGGCGDSITEPDASLARVKAQFQPLNEIAKANSAGYTVWSPDPTVAGST